MMSLTGDTVPEVCSEGGKSATGRRGVTLTVLKSGLPAVQGKSYISTFRPMHVDAPSQCLTFIPMLIPNCA